MHYEKEYVAKSGLRLLVRSALACDAVAVTDMNNQNYADSPFLSRGADDPGDDPEGIRSYIEDSLAAPREAFLVAVVDGEVVGNAHLDGCGGRKKMLHRCEISLGVRREFRNQGVGRCMMEALLSLAKTAGYEQVELNVIEENAPAVSLYRACGFERTGVLPRAYKYPDGSYGDYLFMVKYL